MALFGVLVLLISIFVFLMSITELKQCDHQTYANAETFIAWHNSRISRRLEVFEELWKLARNKFWKLLDVMFLVCAKREPIEVELNGDFKTVLKIIDLAVEAGVARVMEIKVSEEICKVKLKVTRCYPPDWTEEDRKAWEKLVRNSP